MKRTLLIAALCTGLVGGATASYKAKVATVANLKEAITGETTASAKYAAYGKKAREEGRIQVALLFEAASKAEAIHAGNHRAALDQLGETMPEVKPVFEVKSTRENLQDAIKGESFEVATMYPQFIKTANEAGVSIALISFNYAYQTEQKHKVLYQNALAALEGGKVSTLPARYLVCTTCGNTYDNEPPARCGICMTSKERFVTFQ